MIRPRPSVPTLKIPFLGDEVGSLENDARYVYEPFDDDSPAEVRAHGSLLRTTTAAKKMASKGRRTVLVPLNADEVAYARYMVESRIENNMDTGDEPGIEKDTRLQERILPKLKRAEAQFVSMGIVSRVRSGPEGHVAGRRGAAGESWRTFEEDFSRPGQGRVLAWRSLTAQQRKVLDAIEKSYHERERLGTRAAKEKHLALLRRGRELGMSEEPHMTPIYLETPGPGSGRVRVYTPYRSP